MTVALASVPSSDLEAIKDFLPCETPQAWIAQAVVAKNLHVLLIDHANCEKKAAATAVNLIHRYVEFPDLLHKMSRLAREELRHFEQVLAIIKARGFAYPQLTAARYASGLHRGIAKNEPFRMVDTMLVGALIEARSCERFAALVPVLDAELSKFYAGLLRSEARHFQDYLGLARKLAPGVDIDKRLEPLRELEKELILGADTEFRFHSGVPA